MRTSYQARLLVAAAIVLAAVFMAMYVFFVRTYAGQALDQRVFWAVPRQHASLFRLSGAVLDNAGRLAIGGVVLTLLIGGLTRRPRHIVVALSTAALAVATAELAKHVLLTRPITGAAVAAVNSFPSGHAAVAAATTYAVVVVSSRKWRLPIAVVGSALASLVGVFAVVQEWHRLSDVLSSFVLVGAFGCVGSAVLVRWRSGSVRPAR